MADEEVTDEIVEDTEVAHYDAFADLCNRKQGVQCPNPECGDHLYSYVVNKSVNCRCGLTWSSGGSLCLRYGVGYPFTLADVRVVSQRLEDTSFTAPHPAEPNMDGFEEAVAEEMNQTVEETLADGSVVDPEVP